MFYDTVSAFFDAEGDFAENLDDQPAECRHGYRVGPGSECPVCNA